MYVMCLCIYVAECICMHLYASVYICIYLYISVCICMYLYVSVCICMHLYASLCICICVQEKVCITHLRYLGHIKREREGLCDKASDRGGHETCPMVVRHLLFLFTAVN